MTTEYEKFKKFIYEDAIKQWNYPAKLTYIIHEYNIELIKQKDNTITVEKIMEDFKKYPLIREVVMNSPNIILIPK